MRVEELQWQGEESPFGKLSTTLLENGQDSLGDHRPTQMWTYQRLSSFRVGHGKDMPVDNNCDKMHNRRKAVYADNEHVAIATRANQCN